MPLNLAGVQEDVAEAHDDEAVFPSLSPCVSPHATEECLFVCVFVYRFDSNYL